MQFIQQLWAKTLELSRPYIASMRKRESLVQGVAVVTFVAILILGAWGLVAVSRKVPAIYSAISAAAVSLSSIFIPDERIEITIPSANIPSDEPFTLSWSHQNKRTEGTYTVRFACRDGLSMRAATKNGTYQEVFCDTPFNLAESVDSMKLIPSSTNARFLDAPLTVTFTSLTSNEVTAESDLTVTIINEKVSVETAAATSTTQTAAPKASAPKRTTYTTTTAGKPSDPNGHPDLAVTIIATGTLDPSGLFTPVAAMRKTEKGAVRFSVQNLGTKTVENWTFNAVLPTFPMHIFTSPMQPALGPGDRIEFTLGFDGADQNTTGGIITVNVDPANAIWNELSETNNVAKGSISVLN